MKKEEIRLRLSKSEHNRLVNHAKNLLMLKQEAKWDICRIALKVCYIQDKKGKIPKGAYTITMFAEEIGMNRKTLSCWLLDYEAVYSVLNIDDSKLDFSQRKKFSGAISRTRASLYNLKGGRSKIGIVPKEQVRKTFESIINEDPISQRLKDFIKNARHHLYTFKNGKFKAQHKEEIEEYSKILKQIQREISKLI